jgi:hypothetical protein
MTAKEYLQQYQNADREINAKLDQIHRLRELATKTTSTLTPDKVQSSTENKIERIVAKIVDLERDVDADIDKLIEIKQEIEGAIRGLADQRIRLVLYRRYICADRWEQIAVDLSYDYSWVLRLHGIGLVEINKRLKAI